MAVELYHALKQINRIRRKEIVLPIARREVVVSPLSVGDDLILHYDVNTLPGAGSTARNKRLFFTLSGSLLLTLQSDVLDKVYKKLTIFLFTKFANML